MKIVWLLVSFALVSFVVQSIGEKKKRTYIEEEIVILE